MLLPQPKYMDMNLAKQSVFSSHDQASVAQPIAWSNEHGPRPESPIGYSDSKERFPYGLRLCMWPRLLQAKRWWRQLDLLSPSFYKLSMATHWRSRWKDMGSYRQPMPIHRWKRSLFEASLISWMGREKQMRRIFKTLLHNTPAPLPSRFLPSLMIHVPPNQGHYPFLQHFRRERTRPI